MKTVFLNRQGKLTATRISALPPHQRDYWLGLHPTATYVVQTAVRTLAVCGSKRDAERAIEKIMAVSSDPPPEFIIDQLQAQQQVASGEPTVSLDCVAGENCKSSGEVINP